MTPEKEERNREERIRLRALEIWREEGCPDGRAKEHWEQAEREISGREGLAIRSPVKRVRWDNHSFKK